jgi:DNA repair protein RadC
MGILYSSYQKDTNILAILLRKTGQTVKIRNLLMIDLELRTSDYQEKWGDGKKSIQKTGSVVYVQEENREMSITIFLNVLNSLMKENLFFISSIEINLISLNIITWSAFF